MESKKPLVGDYDKEKSDVVASSIGPFSEYGSKVLKAGIEAGTDFIDICDVEKYFK